jgi:hypothetical protein
VKSRRRTCQDSKKAGRESMSIKTTTGLPYLVFKITESSNEQLEGPDVLPDLIWGDTIQGLLSLDIRVPDGLMLGSVRMEFDYFENMPMEGAEHHPDLQGLRLPRINHAFIDKSGELVGRAIYYAYPDLVNHADLFINN